MVEINAVRNWFMEGTPTSNGILPMRSGPQERNRPTSLAVCAAAALVMAKQILFIQGMESD